jgi:hypothetical protein
VKRFPGGVGGHRPPLQFESLCVLHTLKMEVANAAGYSPPLSPAAVSSGHVFYSDRPSPI